MALNGITLKNELDTAQIIKKREKIKLTYILHKRAGILTSYWVFFGFGKPEKGD